MKITLNQLAIGCVLVLGSLFARMASAETIYGKVAFLGTITEENSTNGYHARFRVAVAQSTCGNDSTPRLRWIHVRSGRMEGPFAHNSANTKNAYSSLLVAFLTGDRVQIDGVPGCNTGNVAQSINLWESQIAIIADDSRWFGPE